MYKQIKLIRIGPQRDLNPRPFDREVNALPTLPSGSVNDQFNLFKKIRDILLVLNNHLIISDYLLFSQKIRCTRPMYKSKFFMGELNLTCDKWQKQIRHIRTKNKQDK